MDKIILLTKSEYTKLKCHIKNPRKNNSVCPCCGIPFKIGDILIKDCTTYIHKSCQSKYRFDILEEPTEEELDNFFIIRE